MVQSRIIDMAAHLDTGVVVVERNGTYLAKYPLTSKRLRHIKQLGARQLSFYPVFYIRRKVAEATVNTGGKDWTNS